MTGVIATIPKFQFSNATGTPLINGTVTVYLAGTTTPTSTWQDQALTVANTNPVVLDSRGECVLWLDSTINYKFLLKNAAGVTQWTQDNISGAATLSAISASTGAALVGNNTGGGSAGATVQAAMDLKASSAALAASSGSSLIGYLPRASGTTATTVQTKLRETLSVKDFGAVGNGSTNDAAAFQAAIVYCEANAISTLYVPTSFGEIYMLRSKVNILRGDFFPVDNTLVV